MKRFLVLLFLAVGCSSKTPSYHASDVSQELKKNTTQLSAMVKIVEDDYHQKLKHYQNYAVQLNNKKTFILQDLKWRLQDLKSKKDAVVVKSDQISLMNNRLLIELKEQKIISRRDPSYTKIESFSEAISNEASILYGEYLKYKYASEEFSRFAMFSGSSLKKTTQIRNLKKSN